MWPLNRLRSIKTVDIRTTGISNWFITGSYESLRGTISPIRFKKNNLTDLVLLYQIVAEKGTRAKNSLLIIKGSQRFFNAGKKGEQVALLQRTKSLQRFFLWGSLFLCPWVGLGHTLSSTLPNFWPIIIFYLRHSLLVKTLQNRFWGVWGYVLAYSILPDYIQFLYISIGNHFTPLLPSCLLASYFFL